MKGPDASREFWTEFDWEKELRKDDERVHTYLRELPKFIDLPQEEALIFQKIQRREELIPHGGVWPFEQVTEHLDEEAKEEERAFRESWYSREGADIYIACSKLGRGYCMLSVMDPDASGCEDCIRLLAYLGKIMARLMDIIDLAPGELPALRIALSKRILSDINEIIGLNAKLIRRAVSEEACAHLLSQGAQLGLLREMTRDMLARARHPEKDKPDGPRD